MKREEVPQDESSLSKNKITEVCYATDKDGKYTVVQSQGWAPKTIVQDETLQDIQNRIEEAKALVKSGKASPILYFMEATKMDLNILSSYVGMWQWRVKRHCKPKVFQRLKRKTLQKYADAFEISVEELKNYTGE